MIAAALVALTLPAAAAAIYVINRPLWIANGAVAAPVAATYKALTIRTMLFVVALHILALTVILDVPGVRAVAPRAALVLFGLFWVAVGDLLPRTRPNLLIGLRTSRTLEDRDLWLRMHRTCGGVAVLFGAVVALGGMFLSRQGIAAVVSIAAAASLVTVALAYWIDSAPPKMTTAERRARRIAAAIYMLRIALALSFIYVGIVKIPGRLHPIWVRMFDRIGFGQWFRFFTALVEMSGGMLLLVPSATPAALFLLMSAMAGALLAHVFIFGIGFQTVVVAVLVAGLGTIAWHERTRWPFRSRA